MSVSLIRLFWFGLDLGGGYLGTRFLLRCGTSERWYFKMHHTTNGLFRLVYSSMNFCINSYYRCAHQDTSPSTPPHAIPLQPREGWVLFVTFAV